MSCTDLQQQWGKEKKSVQEKYEAKPFKQFCHPKLKDKTAIIFNTCPEVDAKNFEFLSTGRCFVIVIYHLMAE